jgi:hypothetical protein
MAKPKRKNTTSSCHAGSSHNASKTAYEALAAFNRDVEEVLADLERLGALGLLPEREQRRFLKVCRATLEETRAWTNFEWVDVLRQREEREWARFARIRQREEEKQSEHLGAVLLPSKPRVRTSRRQT